MASKLQLEMYNEVKKEKNKKLIHDIIKDFYMTPILVYIILVNVFSSFALATYIYYINNIHNYDGSTLMTEFGKPLIFSALTLGIFLCLCFISILVLSFYTTGVIQNEKEKQTDKN